MSMMNSTILLLMLAFLFLIIKPAYGNNAEIIFGGNIKASPCEVMLKSVNVDLGTTPLDVLIKDGHGKIVEFKLELKNCPQTTKSVTAYFFGRPFPGYEAWRYDNDGTAKNVAIALTNENDKGLGNGTSYTVPVDSKSRMAILNLVAKIMAGKDASSGSVKGAVQVEFSYN